MTVSAAPKVMLWVPPLKRRVAPVSADQLPELVPPPLKLKVPDMTWTDPELLKDWGYKGP